MHSDSDSDGEESEGEQDASSAMDVEAGDEDEHHRLGPLLATAAPSSSSFLSAFSKRSGRGGLGGHVNFDLQWATVLGESYHSLPH